jgi:hypothetical protein
MVKKGQTMTNQRAPQMPLQTGSELSCKANGNSQMRHYRWQL